MKIQKGLTMKILSKIFLVRMKIRNGHAASFHSVPLDCRSSSSSSLRLFDLHFPFRYGLYQLIPASLIAAQKSRYSCSSSIVRKRFCLVMSFQTDRLMRCHLPFLEMLIWILTHFQPMVFTRQVRYPNPSPRIPVFRGSCQKKYSFIFLLLSRPDLKPLSIRIIVGYHIRVEGESVAVSNHPVQSIRHCVALRR